MTRFSHALAALLVALPAYAGSSIAPRECTSVMNYGAHVLTIASSPDGAGTDVVLGLLALDSGVSASVASQAGGAPSRIRGIIVRFDRDQCRASVGDPQLVDCDSFVFSSGPVRPFQVLAKLDDGTETPVGPFEGEFEIRKIETTSVDWDTTQYELKLGVSGTGDNHLYFNGTKSGLDCAIGR